MFDFQKDFQFTFPVKVTVPTADGQVEKTFTGKFRHVPKAEMDAAVNGKGDEGALAGLRLAFVGWGDDLTQNGKPLAYSDAARDELLTVPFIVAAISTAYWRAMNGVMTEKN